MTCLANEVFTDHLSVTYSPDDSPDYDFSSLVLSLGGVRANSQVRPKGVDYYRLGQGSAEVRRGSNYVKLSLSGSALHYARECGCMRDVLGLLSEAPHKVSRLDAALDIDRDFPEVRRELWERYPTGRLRLGRKEIPVTEILVTRDDGERTGTYYAGKRGKVRCLARIYDKQYEAWERRSEALPPTTRYELEFNRHFGATLRDAERPSAIFYHQASPSLLPKPEGVEVWKSQPIEPWKYIRPEKGLYSRLVGLVENSPEVQTMIEIADQLGPHGRSVLSDLLKARVSPDGATSSLQTLARQTPELLSPGDGVKNGGCSS